MEPIDMEPHEWVEHLANRLRFRQTEIVKYDDYYSGRHPVLFTTSDYREAFGRMLDGYADNWCRIVVDAAVERLTPTGFRFPGVSSEEGESADKDAWAIWRANKLDSRLQVGFVESLVSGISYLMVWYPEGTVVEDGVVTLPPGGLPRITVEHPSEVIVEHDPSDRDKRLAGLKMWGRYGYRRATLFLPDRIYKFAEGELKDSIGNYIYDRNGNIQYYWYPAEPESEWPNPLGAVPIVPLVNRPRLLYPDGESELREIIPNQDAINKLAKDMLVASEYGAFPQRWATGVEVPVDPETNEPIESWTPDIARFLTTANPNARVGSLPAADLSNFVVALDNRVNSMASQSRTPPHYLNASADRLSGESMKAAEAGLVARVREKMIHLGEGILEAMSLAFAILGDERANVQDAVLLWADPETRTEAAHADAVVKKYQSNIIPWQVTVEDLGYSPPEIDRMRKMRQREALEFGFGAEFDDAALADPA
jgi:hypothetical protein